VEKIQRTINGFSKNAIKQTVRKAYIKT
jgi:hypothetical protein